MAAEPGGIASKLGGIYERRFAAELLLRLLAGWVRRLRWEPATGDPGGADIEIEYTDGVTEHLQLKRQNGAEAKWSVAALAGERVLATAASLLSLGAPRRFTFVSADPVPHLKDICDQLTRSSDPAAEFVQQRIHLNQERRAAFEELLRRWSLNPTSPGDVDTAIDRLRAMRFVLLDRGEDGAERLLHNVQLALTGDPAETSALLERFLEDRLGRDVHPQELLDHLGHHGVRPRDLARDPALPSSLLALREELTTSLRERLVAGTHIVRPEVTQIVGLIASPTPPRVVVIHGKPGAGKSGVVLGVADGLVARGMPILPLSLSVRPPEGSLHAYGATLGLKASPVASLRAISGSQRSVVLLDQLDALRLTTSAAAATWHACTHLLRAVIADPDTVLVVACRTFDLENDPNIRRWKQQIEGATPAGVAIVPVGDLRPPDVEPITRSHGVDYASLPPRLQRLLLHPNTLDAWHRLVSRGSTRRDFATQTQLLSELIKELRLEAVRDHGVADNDVHAVLERAREQMESTGRLIVSQAIFDDLPAALHACCAVGLLVPAGGSVSFPHQSYFDHLVARAARRQSGSSAEEVVRWIKRDQSLARREQLRQLLFLLREEDPALAARVTEKLLLDPSIRFHLKHMALGVLREADVVGAHDVDLVVRLAAIPGWKDHLRARVLWRSVTWHDALFTRGVWAKWLSDPDPEQRVAWLNVACSVMEHRPAQADELVAPVLAGPGGVDSLGRVLPFDPAEDSPRVAAVREMQVQQGHWGINDVMLDRLVRRDPARALRLARAVVRGVLRRGLREAAGEQRIPAIRDHALEKEVAAAARGSGARAFAVFSRLLRAAERMKARAEPPITSMADIDRRYFRISSVFSDVIKNLLTLVAQAVCGVADRQPQLLGPIINSRAVRGSEGLSRAVAIGLGLAPDSAADVAIRWLLGPPTRLRLSESFADDPEGLAVDIINRHARQCSPETFLLLEHALLTYFPVEERELYRFLRREYPNYLAQGHPVGRGQHLLLSAVPEDVRSPAIRDRLAIWDAKFGGPAVRKAPAEAYVRYVGSPIPQDRLLHVSDNQWLAIASRPWGSRRWRPVEPGKLAEASPKQFANDFGQAAKADPRRFAKLIRRFPATADPAYLARLLDALGERSTSLTSCEQADLDAIVSLAAEADDPSVFRSACRVIEVHSELPWGEPAWHLLDRAAAHEAPRRAPEPDESPESQADLESKSLNSVRGAAASALAGLAWGNSERAGRALSLIRKLTADPDPAVRAAAAHAAFGVYTVNHDEGVALLVALSDHQDDRVLQGRWLNELLRRARWSHPARLEPLFRRMADSKIPAVAERGAGWATAEYFQHAHACPEVYEKCAKGSRAQRTGVARALTQLVSDDHADIVAAEATLVSFFDDPDNAVRSVAAEVFRAPRLLATESGPRLAAAFVRSAAFEDHSQSLLWPLAHEAVDLTPFSAAVFAAAERFAKELAPQTRSIQHRLALAGRDLSALLLRLYDSANKHGDKQLAESCLDRWDALLENRVGDAEAHLESFSST